MYDALAWAGLAAIAAGAWLIHPAAGLILGGLGLVAAAVAGRIVADRDSKRRKRGE